MRRLLAVLLLACILPAAPAWAQAAPPCQFILGFATLHGLDPADIGDCLDNQAFAANGDAQQHTTNGLMAWRKADNWTAFTNGYWTWINGPYGLAKRLNTQRFSWEANPDGLPLADVPATATVNSACVANVSASVKYPQLGGGTQTIYVNDTNAGGNPVAGASGTMTVYYSTVTRYFDLPATDSGGNLSFSWNVGGPKGVVQISITESAGGCTATGKTSFQGQ